MALSLLYQIVGPAPTLSPCMHTHVQVILYHNMYNNMALLLFYQIVGPAPTRVAMHADRRAGHTVYHNMAMHGTVLVHGHVLVYQIVGPAPTPVAMHAIPHAGHTYHNMALLFYQKIYQPFGPAPTPVAMHADRRAALLQP